MGHSKEYLLKQNQNTPEQTKFCSFQPGIWGCWWHHLGFHSLDWCYSSRSANCSICSSPGMSQICACSFFPLIFHSPGISRIAGSPLQLRRHHCGFVRWRFRASFLAGNLILSHVVGIQLHRNSQVTGRMCPDSLPEYNRNEFLVQIQK